ncbi:transaldolase family protein [Listeria cossartiae subsp. cayugensis]|uniref:Transaldolase family protein n=1 Tax=Listeria cossartiae subsp. cayugensis TaxID=2713505 RepID=A0ABU2ILP2_9LIST|nr:transaldolase family protein [Listeria cossartiae]MDT0049106.1 transaldolase family protein [Listeria cossartiae subsp. cayugensis]MDT0065609.1 transaldolase family protein [Listeria cossartiae subsp. cayugensis]MDT0078787.1 transaldolase family protein [Listeria cossartiae subsp. cayugensis]MDT0081623.1 transaldolase family protein [Listeria cossartiae subsp. cayugensis]MDT0087842.1 transaldolase family protein [Listeria cossartiae subsp. cayugensis]
MFLDTGNLEEIKKALQFPFFEGVTTNPTILLKENQPRKTHIANIPAKLVFVQAAGLTEDEIWEDVARIQAIEPAKGTTIGLKIPAHEDGIKVIAKVRAEFPEAIILATAIFSSEQGYIAALSGADYLAPYYNRMEVSGLDAAKTIEELRFVLDLQGLEDVKIMGASFKNSRQIMQALVSGADTVTIGYDLFLQMMNKPLALESIEKFNEHQAALPK